MVSGQKIAVIIEDDPDVRNLLRTVLTQSGFEAVMTSNGEDGVAAVRMHDPILTTLDVSMPGMDGMAAAAAIREFSDTYIIMITAQDDEIDIISGLNAGADEYLSKPFRPRELRARIASLLRRPRTAALSIEDAADPDDGLWRRPAEPAALQSAPSAEAPASPHQTVSGPGWSQTAQPPARRAYEQPQFNGAPGGYSPAAQVPPQAPAPRYQDPRQVYRDEFGTPPAPAASAEYSFIQAPPPPAAPTVVPTTIVPPAPAPPVAPTITTHVPMTPAPAGYAAAAPSTTTYHSDAPAVSPAAGQSVASQDGSYSHRGLVVGTEITSVRVNGAPVGLELEEFELLRTLMSTGRRVRSKADLVLAARGESYVTSYFVTEHDKRQIDRQVEAIRAKTGDLSEPHQWIETVAGVGYRMAL